MRYLIVFDFPRSKESELPFRVTEWITEEVGVTMIPFYYAPDVPMRMLQDMARVLNRSVRYLLLDEDEYEPNFGFARPDGTGVASAFADSQPGIRGNPNGHPDNKSRN